MIVASTSKNLGLIHLNFPPSFTRMHISPSNTRNSFQRSLVIARQYCIEHFLLATMLPVAIVSVCMSSSVPVITTDVKRFSPSDCFSNIVQTESR